MLRCKQKHLTTRREMTRPPPKMATLKKLYHMGWVQKSTCGKKRAENLFVQQLSGLSTGTLPWQFLVSTRRQCRRYCSRNTCELWLWQLLTSTMMMLSTRVCRCTPTPLPSYFHNCRLIEIITIQFRAHTQRLKSLTISVYVAVVTMDAPSVLVCWQTETWPTDSSMSSSPLANFCKTVPYTLINYIHTIDISVLFMKQTLDTAHYCFHGIVERRRGQKEFHQASFVFALIHRPSTLPEFVSWITSILEQH